MKEYVINLYEQDKISNDGLAKAVSLGWITISEYEAQTGQEYVEPIDLNASLEEIALM